MRGLCSLMQRADKLSPILQCAWGTKTGVPPRTSPWILIPAAKTFQLHCLSARPLAEAHVAPGLAVSMLPSQRSAGTRRALRLLQGLGAVSLSSSGSGHIRKALRSKKIHDKLI